MTGKEISERGKNFAGDWEKAALDENGFWTPKTRRVQKVTKNFSVVKTSARIRPKEQETRWKDEREETKKDG